MDEQGKNYLVPTGTAAIDRHKPTRFTTGVKLAGNGVAVLGGIAAWIPAVILYMLGIWGPVPILAAAIIGVLWAVSIVDSSSLWDNRRLRELSYSELKSFNPDLARGCLGFVGLSTHSYLFRQLQHLDTHEDVGMLCATSSALVFRGDKLNLSISRSSIQAITYRFDPCCSMIGLHWVRVAYQEGSTSRYIYLQSRDKDRLSQLPSRNQALLEKLESWWKGSRMSLTPGREEQVTL